MREQFRSCAKITYPIEINHGGLARPSAATKRPARTLVALDPTEGLPEQGFAPMQGDLRSDCRRGRETRAERDVLCAGANDSEPTEYQI